MDMEESSNGKLEETKKEEALAEETEVVIQGGAEGDESLKETVADENSVDVKESPQNGDNTSSSSSSSSSDDNEESLKEKLESLEVLINPVKLEDEKEEGFDSVEKSVVPLSEVVVDYIGVSDVTALESAVIKEQILPSMDENTGFSPAVLDEKTEETIISSVDGNIGESSSIADINKRNIELEIPASRINQPIISLTQRERHMTSWRSCCGLFDVLRRSNR